MGDMNDPRTDTGGGATQDPPDNSHPRPAPGGVGTGTKGDPAQHGSTGKEHTPPSRPLPEKH